MVALRGGLPALHPQLRRRRRGRGRRHRRDPGPPRPPARPRRRRGVDQPVVPVADGRRGLRRVGLPRRSSPRFGTLGRGRGADRARRTRWACACCWTSCPTTPPTSTPGSRRRSRRRRGRPGARYLFRPGRGDGEPPNDWQSVFGGPAWTRVGRRLREWYLHLFDPGQPDLDWTNPEVVAEFESVLRFWFDQGVDGFRIDVAHGLVKAEGLPDVGTAPSADEEMLEPAHRRRPPVLGPRRRARDLPRLAARWPTPTRTGRCSSPRRGWARNERLARYLRADELHTAFNFPYLNAPWDASGAARA